MKILKNYLNKVGKLVSHGNTTHSCFCMEKMKEDDVVKNKASSPRLDFPLCLKMRCKARKLSEKADMCFKESEIKHTW